MNSSGTDGVEGSQFVSPHATRFSATASSHVDVKLPVDDQAGDIGVEWEELAGFGQFIVLSVEEASRNGTFSRIPLSGSVDETSYGRTGFSNVAAWGRSASGRPCFSPKSGDIGYYEVGKLFLDGDPGELVDGVCLESFQVREFECRDMSGLEVDFGGHACVVGFFPAGGTKAPAVAWLQAGELIHRHRSA